MSGHVEGFFECFVSLTVGSTKGPFAYEGHSIGQFMEALKKGLEGIEFVDAYTGEKHRINDAIVFHVGPTVSSLQHHIDAASKGKRGDMDRPGKAR